MQRQRRVRCSQFAFAELGRFICQQTGFSCVHSHNGRPPGLELWLVTKVLIWVTAHQVLRYIPSGGGLLLQSDIQYVEAHSHPEGTYTSVFEGNISNRSEAKALQFSSSSLLEVQILFVKKSWFTTTVCRFLKSFQNVFGPLRDWTKDLVFLYKGDRLIRLQSESVSNFLFPKIWGWRLLLHASFLREVDLIDIDAFPLLDLGKRPKIRVFLTMLWWAKNFCIGGPWNFLMFGKSRPRNWMCIHTEATMVRGAGRGRLSFHTSVGLVVLYNPFTVISK